MSLDNIDKTQIARSFGRAAESYDSVAHFQRWVADSLFQKLPQGTYDSILDLGCGTGYSSDKLQGLSSTEAYIGLDLSTDMLVYASTLHTSGDKKWVTGDAESLPLRDETQDLVFSSLAVQWCSDFSKMFEEVCRVLKPGGVFAFASLVDGSLIELKEAWQEVDEMQHVNDFSQVAEYRSALSGIPFEVKDLSVEAKVLRYEKVGELTRELKLLGAHNMTAHRPTNMMGKDKLKRFISAYERKRIDQDYLPASYQVLWGVLVKN